MNGMAQGYDPHMLDAANLAKLSWDNVSRMTIARCWVNVAFITVSHLLIPITLDNS